MTAQQKRQYVKDIRARTKARKAEEKKRISEEKALIKETKKASRRALLTDKAKSMLLKREIMRNINRHVISAYPHQYKLQMPTLIGGRGKPGPKGPIIGDWITLVNVNLVTPASLEMLLARYDYSFEEKFFATGGARYDVEEGSRVAVNDITGFVHQNKKTNIVEFFKVTQLLGVEGRREHWDIPSLQNRRVVVLSKYIGWAPWDETAKSIGGFGAGVGQLPLLRGTTTRAWNKDFQITLDGIFD